jgi:hypothetical protein
MNIKKFLKPDWRKIVFMLLFFLFGLLNVKNYTSGSCGALQVITVWEERGFPFTFQVTKLQCSPIIFILIPAFLDLIFWYLFSCLIVWIYDKVKKK